jgi:O-antigen/teichoic acid export membrane protein
LREAYLKVIQLTGFLSIPAAAGIFLLAPDFVLIFLGEKWIPMIPALQVLALWGMIRSIGATTGPVFHATGNPKILTQLQFAVLILLLISILPLTMKWGILGTSLSVTISTLIPNIIAVYIITRIVNCKYWDILKQILPTLINTTIIIIFTIFLKYFLINTIGILELILIILLYLVAYSGLAYIFGTFLRYYRGLFLIFSK